MTPLPWPFVCAWCERVRTLAGRWEDATRDVRPEEATHGICPECLAAQQQEAAAAEGAR